MARLLSEDLVFEGRTRFQLAPDENLPVARLFGAGGAETVRGYPTNTESGDSGITASAQLSLRNFDGIEALKSVDTTPFVFVDAGAVRPFGGSTQTMVSAGAGAQVGLTKKTSAIALVAVPLSNTQNFMDRGDVRLYVGVDMRF